MIRLPFSFPFVLYEINGEFTLEIVCPLGHKVRICNQGGSFYERI